jgi:hypothetical protein
VNLQKITNLVEIVKRPPIIILHQIVGYPYSRYIHIVALLLFFGQIDEIIG